MNQDGSELIQQSLPPESLAPAPDGPWTVAKIWMDDIINRDIPGGVVILILLVIFLPKMWNSWMRRGR